MYLTGFADEAAQDIEGQIKATKELGWNAIESRNISGKNIHDISDEDFDVVYGKLQDAGVKINCFGSAIGNWAKNILDPFEITIAEIERAIPRMQRLGTDLIRIMSYARCEGEEQYKEERFRRLREIVKRFNDAGLTPVHENCMNYGGMSAAHTLELVENVPGLRLVFDTGNGPFNKDYSTPDLRWQNSLEFYNKVKQHVSYIHIKDANSPESGEKEVYTMPGEGQGDVVEIMKDLKASGYDGGISIEPHLAAVFHDPSAVNTESDKSYELYVEYGRRMMAILDGIGYERSLY
ncbi:sugar phosphate isomerase/epimerase family protein [Pelagicoccus mobilis]|uniref:Sugar phosphate isomerase/epimerase n=1 Tax=Pelagicoccus mobilis TaxID=415221 RepID=A0A934VNF0_9BACT|nr:sugar phosphate isomerase/epimerase family protein [Pelagicoccus mobilis]MBK1879876.1 sugar phosphate isomerase/epimerase [Pelagicoccus mobilis]